MNNTMTFMKYMKTEDGMLARVETSCRSPLNVRLDQDSEMDLKPGTRCELDIRGYSGDFRIFQDKIDFYEYAEEKYDIRSTEVVKPVGTYIPPRGWSMDDSWQKPAIVFSGVVQGGGYYSTTDKNKPNYSLEIKTFDMVFDFKVRYDGKVRVGDYVCGEALLYATMKHKEKK